MTYLNYIFAILQGIWVDLDLEDDVKPISSVERHKDIFYRLLRPATWNVKVQG